MAADSRLDRLAKAGRPLKGYAQARNSGADIFLADPKGQYIGRVCHWRECRPGMRLACQAQRCGQRELLSDDLQVPVDSGGCTAVIRRVAIPADVEQILLQPLQVRR